MGHMGVRNPHARMTHQPRLASKSWKPPAAASATATIQRTIAAAGQPAQTTTTPATRHNTPETARAIRPLRWMFGVMEPSYSVGHSRAKRLGLGIIRRITGVDSRSGPRRTPRRVTLRFSVVWLTLAVMRTTWCGDARRSAFAIVTALMLAAGASCKTGGSPHAAPTRTDRLRDTYADLRKGPFALIADFENTTHYELFRASAETPVSAVRPDTGQGRAETGPGCLAFTAAAESDTVLVNNAGASQWYLKRDWRRFDLLLLSVHVPVDGLMFEIAISSGRPPDEVTAEATLPLRKGWNALRLDLGELGEQITLDEVGELRFSFSNVAQPVTVYFDDVILSASREDIFGDSSNDDGRLYVQRAGRRWHIGAGGRFELVFANGQITGWYNLAADPYRLRNMVRGTSLGPSPITLPEAAADDRSTARTSGQVVSRQVLQEMNPVRVVIETEWRFVADGAGTAHERPDYRWTYTIYPTGQLYVVVETKEADDAESARGFELAVALAAHAPEEWRTRVVEASSAQRAAVSVELPAYIAARSESADAYLLFVPWAGAAQVAVREVRGSAAEPVSLSASYRGAPGEPQRAACHIWLSSTADVADREALERARAYAAPPALDPRIGQLGSSSQSPFGDAGGFDPGGGTFSLTPESGRVLVGLGGSDRPLFQPAFSIAKPDDIQSWVYANHVILEPTALDRAGHLLFQIPHAVREPMLVEVLFRQIQTTSGP